MCSLLEATISQCHQKLNRIFYLQNSDVSQDQITPRNYVFKNTTHVIKCCEKNAAKSLEMPNKGVSRIK
jgi:hypothetical protein